MCIICGLYDAVVRRTDGIYVLPITALKPWKNIKKKWLLACIYIRL